MSSFTFDKFTSPSGSPFRVSSPSLNHLKIVITGGAGQIAYSLLPYICKGEVFGTSTVLTLHLLDIPPAINALEGVRMELQDASYTLVKEVVCTTDMEVAFSDVDYAIILGGFPRKPGMERRELIEKNSSIMVEQGMAIDKLAKKTCKILVTANPANTNCLILMKYAPSIPTKNFTCLTRLDQDRFKGMLSSKLKAMSTDALQSLLEQLQDTTATSNDMMILSNQSSKLKSTNYDIEIHNQNDSTFAPSIPSQESFLEQNELKQPIVWGNHSNTQYPWTGLIEINGKAVANLLEAKLQFEATKSKSVVLSSIWKENKFKLGWSRFGNLSEDWKEKFEIDEIISRVRTRGAAVLAARKLSSALSAANSIKNHLVDWHFGTTGQIDTMDKYTSMGVLSTGNPYGVPDDLIYSFPVVIDSKTGIWQFAPSHEITLSDFDKQNLRNSSRELEEERAVITTLPSTRKSTFLEAKPTHNIVQHAEVSRL